MHRLLVGLPPKSKEKVDHINGQTLDNRKQNLRICSQAENCRNRSKDRRNTTGYKGPVWNRGAWAVRITFNYKGIYVGRYDTLEEAARAYNLKAKELFGEFAKLNDVPDGPITPTPILDRNNSSGYRGVSLDKKRQKWVAVVGSRKNEVYVGRFDNPIEAAKARDKKAFEMYGHKAKLNFPIQSNQQ